MSTTNNTDQGAQSANTKSMKDSTTVMDLEHLGESPAYIDCPHCEKRTLTKVEQIDSIDDRTVIELRFPDQIMQRQEDKIKQLVDTLN